MSRSPPALLLLLTLRMASERARDTRRSSPLRFLPSTSNLRRDQMASNGLLRSSAAAARAFMATLAGPFFPFFFPLLFFFSPAAAAAAMGFVFAMAGSTGREGRGSGDDGR